MKFRLISLIVSATALVALAAEPARAQAQTADEEDVGCFVLFMAMAGQMTATQPEATEVLAGLASGALYHLGRLEGRSPGVDWLEVIYDRPELFTEQAIQDDVERCSTSLGRKGQDLIDWGQRLQELGARLQPSGARS